MAPVGKIDLVLDNIKTETTIQFHQQILMEMRYHPKWIDRGASKIFFQKFDVVTQQDAAKINIDKLIQLKSDGIGNWMQLASSWILIGNTIDLNQTVRHIKYFWLIDSGTI